MIRERLTDLFFPRPRYVEQCGNPIGCQPYVSERSTITSFVLDADHDALKALVDRNLNAPRGLLDLRGPLALATFVPLMPKVFLVAADLPLLRSGHASESARGYTPETDVAFWVPVALVRQAGPLRWVDWIGFFLPFLYVDEGWALIAGRETFGMPKLVSSNTLPRKDDDPGLFTVDTQVLPTYARDTRAVTQRLITARRTDAPTRGPLTPSITHGARLCEKLIADALGSQPFLTLPGLDLCLEAADCVAKMSSKVVTLKQFRDAEDPRFACFQSVLECSFKYTSFRGAGTLDGTWQVEIDDYESHPLLRDLGLQRCQTATGAPWMQLDFTMNPARTLWSAR